MEHRLLPHLGEYWYSILAVEGEERRPYHRPVGADGDRLPPRYFRSTASGYGYNAASIAVAIVVTPVLVRHLGKERYGVWILASSLIVYLDLLQFGFGQSAITHFARARGRNDDEAIGRIASTAFVVLGGAGAMALVVVTIMLVVVPAHLGMSPHLRTEMQVVLLLGGASFALAIPSGVFGALLVSHQRIDLLNLSLGVGMLVEGVACIVAVRHGGGLVMLGVVTASVSVGGQVARWLMCRRLVPDFHIRLADFDRSLVRPLGSLSVWYAIRNAARVVIDRIDALVVGLVVSVPAAAVYSIGQRLAFFITRSIEPVNAALFPYAAELSVGDERGPVKESAIAASRMTLWVAWPLCLTVALFADELLDAWVGSGFAAATTIVRVLCLSVALASLASASVNVFGGLGHARPAAFASMTEAAVNFSCSIALGYAIGARGVAYGTLVATATVQVAVFLPHVLRRLDIPLREFGGRVVATQVPALVVASLVGVAARQVLVPGGSVLTVLIGCPLTFASYWVVVVATGMAADERARLAHLLPIRI